MKVINNSVLIDISLTDKVFEELTLFLTGLDDINLKIENSTITTKKIELPDAVSSVCFENCLFTAPTIISNLKEGRLFSIKNCKRGFFLGNVKLKRIHCSSVIIDQREIHNYTECLSPDIEKSLIEYFDCKSDYPQFSQRLFLPRRF